jgi:hypothetical protein
MAKVKLNINSELNRIFKKHLKDFEKRFGKLTRIEKLTFETAFYRGFYEGLGWF